MNENEDFGKFFRNMFDGKTADEMLAQVTIQPKHQDERNNRFTLNKLEWQLAENFENRHLHDDIDKGAIGGGINYRFTSTGVGSTKVVTCTICNKEENVTDFTAW